MTRLSGDSARVGATGRAELLWTCDPVGFHWLYLHRWGYKLGLRIGEGGEGGTEEGEDSDVFFEATSVSWAWLCVEREAIVTVGVVKLTIERGFHT